MNPVHVAMRQANTWDDFRLAASHLHEAERLRLAPVICLSRRLEAIPRQSSETDVLSKQFAWWLQTLNETRKGSGQHPELLALAKAMEGLDPAAQDDVWNLMTRYVTVLSEASEGCRLDDEKAWQAFALKRQGCVLRVLALLTGQPAHDAWLVPAAQLWTCADLVLHFPEDATHGLFLWPLDRIAAHQLTPEQLVKAEPNLAKDSYWLTWQAFAEKQLVTMQEALLAHSVATPFAEFLVVWCGLMLHEAFTPPLDPMLKHHQAETPWRPWKQLFRAWRLRTRFRQLERKLP
jgi:hypothetical protein